jgi:prophage regulatory protein
MARPEVSERKLLSYDDLQARGIRFSRVHLRRLERAGLFPMRVTIGSGNCISWFEHEVDQYLDRLADPAARIAADAARSKRARRTPETMAAARAKRSRRAPKTTSLESPTA